jgi:hypothetical protein
VVSIGNEYEHALMPDDRGNRSSTFSCTTNTVVANGAPIIQSWTSRLVIFFAEFRSISSLAYRPIIIIKNQVTKLFALNIVGNYGIVGQRFIIVKENSRLSGISSYTLNDALSISNTSMGSTTGVCALVSLLVEALLVARMSW